MLKAFKIYDANKDGTISASEFKQVLLDMGKRDVTEEQTMTMLKSVDRNNDDVIQWEEFLDLFKQMKGSDSETIKQVL